MAHTSPQIQIIILTYGTKYIAAPIRALNQKLEVIINAGNKYIKDDIKKYIITPAMPKVTLNQSRILFISGIPFVVNIVQVV